MVLSHEGVSFEPILGPLENNGTLTGCKAVNESPCAFQQHLQTLQSRGEKNSAGNLYLIYMIQFLKRIKKKNNGVRARHSNNA